MQQRQRSLAYEYESLLNGQVKRWHERTSRKIASESARAALQFPAEQQIVYVSSFVLLMFQRTTITLWENAIFAKHHFPFFFRRAEESNAFCVNKRYYVITTSAVVRCENVLRILRERIISV